MRTYTGERLVELARQRGLPVEQLRDLRVVGSVLPFRVNEYVVDELIDWSAAPDDPIFRLTFPHRDMLPAAVYQQIAAAQGYGGSDSGGSDSGGSDSGGGRTGGDPAALAQAVQSARFQLNPHPGAQLEANVPVLDGERVDGLQHKYAETVLIFPSPGQTCHAYCGYCFRWAQFVGIAELRQALRDPLLAARYVASRPEVTDVLFTGGDPMIMSATVLRRYVEPLLGPATAHLRTLRFGTKALSYWPYRFTTDRDADAMLRLFEQCVAAGKHVAVMAHFSHPRELDNPAVRAAIVRIRGTGAVIRTQAPLVAHVNDDPVVWATMWQRQVELGLVPYYMFVERDTGAHGYFGVPLTRALEVYTQALRRVSGLARTARGPVMSAAPGKILLDGTATVGGEQVFALRMLQSRQPEQVGRIFFARHDPAAQWWDDLVPAAGSAFPPMLAARPEEALLCG